MVRIWSLFLILILVLLSAGGAYAQDDLQNDLKKARDLRGKGRHAEAADLYRRIVNNSPQGRILEGALYELADSLTRINRNREALEFYNRIVALSPPSPYRQIATTRAVRIYVQLGLHDGRFRRPGFRGPDPSAGRYAWPYGQAGRLYYRNADHCELP